MGLDPVTHRCHVVMYSLELKVLVGNPSSYTAQWVVAVENQ